MWHVAALTAKVSSGIWIQSIAKRPVAQPPPTIVSIAFIKECGLFLVLYKSENIFMFSELIVAVRETDKSGAQQELKRAPEGGN